MAYQLLFFECTESMYFWVAYESILSNRKITNEIWASPATLVNTIGYWLAFTIPYMCPEPSKEWLFNQLYYMKEQDSINV